MIITKKALACKLYVFVNYHCKLLIANFLFSERKSFNLFIHFVVVLEQKHFNDVTFGYDLFSVDKKMYLELFSISKI